MFEQAALRPLGGVRDRGRRSDREEPARRRRRDIEIVGLDRPAVTATFTASSPGLLPEMSPPVVADECRGIGIHDQNDSESPTADSLLRHSAAATETIDNACVADTSTTGAVISASLLIEAWVTFSIRLTVAVPDQRDVPAALPELGDTPTTLSKTDASTWSLSPVETSALAPMPAIVVDVDRNNPTEPPTAEPPLHGSTDEKAGRHCRRC